MKLAVPRGAPDGDLETPQIAHLHEDLSFGGQRREAPLARHLYSPAFNDYVKRFDKADAAFWDRTVTVKGFGDLPAWRAVAYICLSHGMMHVGQLEMTRTLVGARPVIGV